MALQAVEKVTIDDLLGRLNTADDFSAFLQRTIVDGSPTQEIKGHEDEPAGAVKGLYCALLDNEARRGQLDAFEEAAFRILLDQSQYFARAYDKEFVGVHMHKGMHKAFIRNAENAITSPNLKSGKLAEIIKPHINLEGIASGKVRYEPEKPREDDVNMTFGHQRMLVSLLFGAQTKEGRAAEFWEKIASNPSFLEIKFNLALIQGGDAKQLVPGLIKFYNSYYSKAYTEMSKNILLSVIQAGLLEESATIRYLRERNAEVEKIGRTLEKTDPHLLDRLNKARAHSTLSMLFDDAVCVLTDYRKSGRTVTVECMRISGEGIERGITATGRLEEMPEYERKLLELPKGTLHANNSWKPRSSVVSHLSSLESSYRNFIELYDKARERVEKGRQLEMKLEA